MITASPATLPTTPPTTVCVETGGPLLLPATLPTAAVLEEAVLELVVAPAPPPIMTPAEVDAGWKDEKVVEPSEDDVQAGAVDDREECEEELEEVV